MKTRNVYPLRSGLLVLGIILALFTAAFQPLAVQAATLPATTCSESGGLRACDLWATTGTLSLPGGVSVTFWGYAPDNVSPASLPGPTLIANAGEALVITLHNNLSEATSLSIPSLSGPADLSGVAAGGAKSYLFNNLQPGTYIYQAGPTQNGQRQVALGMYGVLIVRPAGAPTQAFASSTSAFDDEAVLVMSEIDPALHAAPATFDLNAFAPKYFLFNGKAFPDTAPIDTLAGNRLLLRVVNAGMQSHSLGVLGLRYAVLSTDGVPLAQPYTAVAETIGAGQTADVLIQVPAAAPAGVKYAVYDSSMRLLNNGKSFGGMLTFINLAPAPNPGDVSGPAASGLSLSPNPSSGSSPVTLNAVISDVDSGNNNIAAAEYFLDATGASGSGIALLAQDSAFDSPSEAVTATIDPTPLASGNHNVYVHGQDALGNWGSFNVIVLSLDKTGPLTTSLLATPNPTNGSVNVVLSGTADDSTKGSSNIQAAEYFIDVAGADGTGAAMTLNQTAPVAAITATIPAATVAALPEGNHTLYVHSLDSSGNWGSFATLTLQVDKTGPAASNLLLRPNPNNGTLTYSPTTAAVRLDVTASEPGGGPITAAIKKIEFFIDYRGATLDPDGSGVPMTPVDGLFNSASETGYTYIPLTTVQALPEGVHPISAHALDSAGNWGPFSTVNLIVDRTKPVVNSVSFSPNPTGTSTTTVLSAVAQDVVVNSASSSILKAEWYQGTDPGIGKGNAITITAGAGGTYDLSATINVSTWARGTYTLFVRVGDAAGNWSQPTSAVLTVGLPDLLFTDSFESGDFAAWSATSGSNLSVTTAAAMGTDGGTRGMQVALAGNTPGYVQDNSPLNETRYFARFYFNPHSTLTGSGNQRIFTGYNTAGAFVFAIEYRRTNSGGGTYQVRAVVSRTGGTTSTNWVTIANNTAHPIEIEWNSASAAAFRFYVDGVLQQTLTNLNTSAYLLDYVRLGPSSGLVSAASGTEYFDAFVSKRYTRP
jgi:FtsP/CotA-like multicopper oxidase with cupredoxin domain